MPITAEKLQALLERRVFEGEEEAASRIKRAHQVNQDFIRFLSYRNDWLDDRQTAIDFYESRQWPNPSTKKIQVTENRIMPAINHVMSIVSRAKFTVVIEGVGPEDAVKGKIMNRIFEDADRQDSTEFKVFECIRESRKVGLGVGKEVWDYSKNFPFGEPRFEVVPSDEIFIQPGARGMQYEDADRIIHAVRYTVEKLRAKYPDFKDEIQSDAQWISEGAGSRTYVSTATTDKTYRLTHLGGSPFSPEGEEDVAYLKEEWYKKYERELKYVALRDIRMVSIPIFEDDQTGETGLDGQPRVVRFRPGDVLDEKDVFESGLNLVPGTDYEEIPIVVAKMWVARVINDVTVEDHPSPFGHQEFPFIFFKAITLDKYTYPAGDIIFLVDLQVIRNKIRSVGMDNMIRNNNAPLWSDGPVSKPTKDMYKKYGAYAGMILETRRGGKLTRLPPGEINPEVYISMLRGIDAAFDELAGVTFQAPQTRSGEQERENRLTNEMFHQPKNSPIQMALLWLGRMRMANVQKFMKGERMVRIDERLYKALEGTPQKAFLGRDSMDQPFYTVNKQGETPDGQTINLNDPAVGRFDLKVMLAADYAETRRSRAEVALGLRKGGDMTRKRMLEDLGYEDAEAIDAELNEQNSLLQMGKQVAEDPVLMAAVQNPQILQQLKMLVESQAGAAPAGPPAPTGPETQPPMPAQ